MCNMFPHLKEIRPRFVISFFKTIAPRIRLNGERISVDCIDLRPISGEWKRQQSRQYYSSTIYSLAGLNANRGFGLLAYYIQFSSARDK